MTGEGDAGVGAALHELHDPGRSSGSRHAMSAAADAGESGEAFHTQAFPCASAGASFHAGIASGKFQGVMSPTTPRGRRRVMRSERPSAGG